MSMSRYKSRVTPSNEGTVGAATHLMDSTHQSTQSESTLRQKKRASLTFRTTDNLFSPNQGGGKCTAAMPSAATTTTVNSHNIDQQSVLIAEPDKRPLNVQGHLARSGGLLRTKDIFTKMEINV